MPLLIKANTDAFANERGTGIAEAYMAEVAGANVLIAVVYGWTAGDSKKEAA